MNKAKIIIMAIGVFAIASGVVAFKAPSHLCDLILYTGPAGSGVYTTPLEWHVITTDLVQPQIAVSPTLKTKLCPNGRITTAIIN